METSVETTISLRLPFARASVAVARRTLKDWLREQGGSTESVEDARVVISEMVANSVRHARPLADGNIIVVATLEDRAVRVSVTDGGGSTRPRNVHAPSSALAGRGMAIIDVLSERWWIERTPSRCTVHAQLPV